MNSFHFHIHFHGGMPLIYSSERIASAISSYALPRLYGTRKGSASSSPRPSICIPGCVRVRTFKFPEYSPLFSSTCLFRYFHRWKSNFSQFFATARSALKLCAWYFGVLGYRSSLCLARASVDKIIIFYEIILWFHKLAKVIIAYYNQSWKIVSNRVLQKRNEKFPEVNTVLLKYLKV